MLLFILFSLTAGEWVETTQQDFKDGFFERNLYTSHQGDGAVEFVGRWDFNNDGYIDVAGDDWIMWGSKSGYLEENKTDYYVSGGLYGGCDGADLNTDGYPEFVTTEMCGTVRIFWGKKEGPDPNNPTVFDVPGYNNEGAAIADLDKDGYLDLIISCFDNSNTGIFWGSNDGYSMNDVTLLPVNESGFNPEAADLNKDGWLDVIVIAGNTYQGQQHYIYYGSAEGFSVKNRTTVEYGHGGPHGMSVADLNYDGWLDLIYSANIPCYAAILWGGKEVFKPGIEVEANYVLPLPDRAYGGSSINHLNNDEFLDIVFFGNDGVPPRIFWGDAEGISPSRYTDLSKLFPVGAGGIVADFNYDGHMDLFEYNRGGPSCFLWGPDFEASHDYSVGTHHGFSREIGGVYTRATKEYYYSSVYDARMDLHWIETEWEDHCPGDSKVRIAIRTGAHPDDFKREITISAANDPWIETTEGKNISDVLMGCNQRYIQYRATFEYQNPAELPMLSLVRIRYEGKPLEDQLESVGNPNDDMEFSVAQEAGYSQWRISLSTATFQRVDLAIYDIRGSRVRTILDSDGVSGTFEIVWDGRDDNERLLPGGVYFVRLSQPANVETAKVVLIR